jgi:UDP-N-acetylglucosamine 4,6-dehydratase
MQQVLALLGRRRVVFAEDLERTREQLSSEVQKSSFLVIGGAGSIGQQVVREVFERKPVRLHVIDISENNLVELVRDLRSSLGYISGDFRTLPLDCGSCEFTAFLNDQAPYDYVLNLSALKHVRSEKDPYTMMRMVRVNVLNTQSTLEYAARAQVKKYFAVSSDKAVNPASAMGATKRVMELCLLRASCEISVSSARFANVAFSDGSLLHGFTQRIEKRQPLSAPKDVRRYFMTPMEAGQLCLMSTILGTNREIFVPKPNEELSLKSFPAIAERFLRLYGYEVHECSTEEEARSRIDELLPRKKWPCHFFDSDTQGEKQEEELFTSKEDVDFDRFGDIGVIRNQLVDCSKVEAFLTTVRSLLDQGRWNKKELSELLLRTVPEFDHQASDRSLDERM